jgi:hypothetical protein
MLHCKNSRVKWIMIHDGSRKPDVLGIKLVFLRTLTLRHPNNDDRVDNDDNRRQATRTILKSDHFFPSILTFLELLSLKLEENVPNRLPLPLLLRQEYKVISELIQKEPPQRRFGNSQ